MRYINQSYEIEITINKSRFIATLQPVSSAQGVSDALKRIKEIHPKANHHCFAAMIGPGGEQQSASDDGEPSRTAGIPILEVIKHHDVTNVLIIVTRYFGGIKLGAGGLVRAYTKAASDVLKNATFLKRSVLDVYQIAFTYDKIDHYERHFQDHATMINQTYADVVTYELALDPKDRHLIEDIRYQLKSCEIIGQKEVFVPEFKDA
ncbi:MAG: YigZ family protein [Acholeplasmataceae bacterium]|nr:YigZ family protein [Acholeplasmataceae bacterium]